MAGTLPISVAIPCYGHEAALKTSLQHILRCDPLPQEILLHYDGGWEPKEDFTALFPVPVRVLRSDKNLGPGGGRDLLFKAAAHDLIASFDDDSWPLDKDYFAQALALMNVFPNAAVASPAVYLREKPILPRIAEASDVVSFEGSATVTRRSHYLKLPGYVPVPLAYGVEEVDLSLQAHAAGYDVLSSPWLRAWHDRPYAENEHSILPWIRNEVLLAFLRYPLWLQPWGWLRAVRHILKHYSLGRARALFRTLANSPAHCKQYVACRRRYRTGEIWRHHFAPRKRWTLAQTRDELQVTEAPEARRVLYIQYTNPAAYPPLEHSSKLLASRGWEIRFAGIAGRGTAAMEFPPFPRIQVWQRRWCPPGMMQKVHYLRFTLWCVFKAWRVRPDWLYCSDALSALPGLWAQRLTGARIVYHEHDSPSLAKGREKLFATFWRDRRQMIARKAAVIILPNQERLDFFLRENPTSGKTFCVWNCPSINDVSISAATRQAGGPLRVLYHGSIVPDRFPVTVLEALAACDREVVVRLIGYEVPGMMGYTDFLKQEAKRLGVQERFEYLGTLSRHLLLPVAAECDVGLSLLNHRSEDINMRCMTGASNKPFDYLSQGLALVVPRSEDWEALYVARGCAIACQPNNAQELSETFRWLSDHREEVRRMGKKGCLLVQQEWNYEAKFAPVAALMEQPETHAARY